MAKASFIMHGARGRIGNVVGYQREGEKLMRALPTSVKNPQTDEQTITRLALSSAAKTAQHLRGIVDHSFQGVKYGQKSVNYFTSKLAKEIREFMKSAMAAGSSIAPFGTAPVLPYSAGAVAAGAQALIAKGDLAALPFSFYDAQGGGFLIGKPGIFEDWSIDDIWPSNYEMFMGVPFTDQLTFIVGAPVELDYISETELFYGVRFAYQRVNFKSATSSAPSIFVEAGGDLWKLNMDFVDTERSSVGVADWRFRVNPDSTLEVIGLGDKELTNSFDTEDVCLAAVITSRFENGAWRRSTTRLIQNPKTIQQTAAAFESKYGYNDITSVLALAAPKKAGVEDRYLNKEKN